MLEQLNIRPIQQTLHFLQEQLRLHQFKLRGQIKRRHQMEKDEIDSKQTIRQIRTRIDHELDTLQRAKRAADPKSAEGGDADVSA